MTNTATKTEPADYTFAIQRHEQETDFDDYVVYYAFLVSYLDDGNYTLTAIATDYMTTKAQAKAKCDEFAALFVKSGSTAEVIDLPTVRRRLPAGW